MPPVPPEYFVKSPRAHIVDCYVGKVMAYIIISFGCLFVGQELMALGMGMGLLFSVVSYYTGKQVALASDKVEEQK